jgi:5'-nucleotidase
MRRIEERKYAINGTPTDCVMMALNHIMVDEGPDLILSGVNRGGNLGEDILYSGTCAVAMEGTLLRVRSIALSQCLTHGEPVKWATAERYAPGIIQRILDSDWDASIMINVNFPDVEADEVSGVEMVPQGRRDLSQLRIEERVDARGIPYYWLGFRPQSAPPKPGTDLAVVAEGGISVTPVSLDLTHHPALENLESALT